MEKSPRDSLSVRHSKQSRFLLNDLVRDVSRSFYLTLRVLPKTIRDQIALAYLLARTTDTIADSESIPISARLSALQKLRQAILAPEFSSIELPSPQSKQSPPAERVLLQRINDALELLFATAPGDRARIQSVLRTISEGQELDLRRFGPTEENQILSLASQEELDDYTYRVAGCVGEFWTRTCLAHLHPKPQVSEQDLIDKGVQFGKGLQLVNVLRDLPADLRNGRCYLPENDLGTANLSPADLLDEANEKAVRPVYDRWLSRAEENLHTGWSYVLALPFSWYRVRLACAWPVLIGLKTILKLRAGQILNPDVRLKVSRPEIKSILAKSITACPFPKTWARLPQSILSR